MNARKRPDWVRIDGRGLRGGICVTGSVGSGKSVSTLLPWAEQLFEFNPRPSFFIGDPKCTFADDFIELVKAKGLESELVHFSLNGVFKMNPIYRKHMLRDGGFAEVGQMIRMAQINFMGRESGEGKFWGMKANDLVKNVLRFCAGFYGVYFTLIDFYKVLVEADTRDFEMEIQQILENGNFNLEERENLKFAYKYFQYEFKKMEEKIKSGIVSTATAFLSQLMEYQASQIICPKKEDVNFTGFDDIVDRGKIFVLDIRNEGLSKAIGTICKLQYQTSVLNRNRVKERKAQNKRLAVSIIDEYPLIASVGGGEGLGDDTYRATGRSAGAVDIYAMQGHTSLFSALGDREACETLLLNFRTHITLHSLDSKTADFFSRIGGEIEVEKENESFSESGKDSRKDLFSNELVAKNQSVTRSLSRSTEKKKRVTAEKLAALNTFEAMGLVFEDGVVSKFYDDLCLKPSFLDKRETPHSEVLELLKTKKKKSLFQSIVGAVFCLLFLLPNLAQAASFPTICSVVNTPQFEKIFSWRISPCMCKGVPPRPCIRSSYYLPFQFLEVRSDSQTLFKGLPGVASQLSSMSESMMNSGGIGEESGYFYHARTLAVPFVSMTMGQLPCGGAPLDRTCFDATSEHLGKNWMMPVADQQQPKFLAWLASGPKLCHMKGSLSSATGSPSGFNQGSPMCSVPREFMTQYPPTMEPVCTGWGQLIPRTGFVDATSTVNASLLAGARFKSLASEVFMTSPSSPDEKWQMIYPNSSSDFRRGQNLGLLALSQVNERGRVSLTKQSGHLYAIWKKVSCCKDVSAPLEKEAIMAFIKGVCRGLQ